jgi:hypothetical protein
MKGVVNMDFKELREKYQNKYNVILQEGLFNNEFKTKNDDDLWKELNELRIEYYTKGNHDNRLLIRMNKISDELEKRKKKDEKKNKNHNKKEEMPKVVEHDGNKVRADLNKITAEVKKMLNQPEIKKFVNNGLKLVTGDARYELTDKDSDVYESGVDEFVLIDVDLWDYKGGNPRELINNSPDGWHPVNYAVEKLNNDIEELLKNKFPDFYLAEYGGDWDTGSIEIGLK